MSFARRVVVAVCLAFSIAWSAPARAEGRVQSPMTATVVARLRAVLARGAARDAFVKVGDSNTANPSFLRCFAGDDVRLGDHRALETTRAFFHAHKVDALHDAFARVSVAATPGWLTAQVLAGEPPHLLREIAEVKPAFAIVMLGTNDNRPGGVPRFQEKIAEVVDRILAVGVIPILSTVPPRDDDRFAAARVPEINATIRALAASRVVPLVDLHAALAALPKHGLGPDGIHLAPAATADGTPHPCWLDAASLTKGMNVRNLVTLTALDRARRFVLEGEAPEANDAA